MGLLKSRHSFSQFLIGLILFDSDGVLLSNTRLSDSSDFRGFDIGLLVFNLELSKQSSGLISSNFKGGIFLLKIDLKLINTTCGFSKFFETIVDVLFFNINTLELLDIDLLIHIDKGKIGLGGNIHMTTHLLEVNSADIIDHLMHLTHMLDKGLFDLLFVVNLELLKEFL